MYLMKCYLATVWTNLICQPSLPTPPPTKDGDVDKARGIQPPATHPQPVIADLPQADNVIELPHYEVGGMAPGVLELGIMEPQVESVAYPTETPVVLTPPHIPQGEPLQRAIETNISPLTLLPPTEQQSEVESTEQESILPPPPSTPPPRVIEYFRTGAGSFVTTNTNVRTTVTGSATIEHSIEKVLKRHRIEMSRSDTSNISVKEALRTRGEEASRVIVQELKQMLDKVVWVPIAGVKLTATQRSAIIRSSMFLKRKNNPDGTFNKLKARLVAGGDQQNKGLYDDLSSPTVSTSAVLTLIAVAAHERRHVAVVDISGAYLNANMSKVRLDRTMANFITNIDSRYKKYEDAGGGIIVLLKKALYGCVDSAGLWYENLRDTMSALGYTRNECDRVYKERVRPVRI